MLHYHPRQPFRNLRLGGTRGHFADFLKCGLDIHGDVAGIRASHVAVKKIDDDGDFALCRSVLIGRIFRREGVRHIYHVGHLADCACDGHVIDVYPSQRVRRQRGAKQIVRFEFPDRLPQRSQERRRNLQARFARWLVVRKFQQLELIAFPICAEVSCSRRRILPVSSRVRNWCPALPSVQTMTRALSAGPSFLRQSSNVPAAENSKSSKCAWTQRIFMFEEAGFAPHSKRLRTARATDETAPCHSPSFHIGEMPSLA